MKKLKPIFLLCLMFFLPSCCPPSSIHPLSPLEEAQYDEHLEGTWIFIDEDEKHGYLHIGETKGNLTKALLIEQNKSLEFSVYMMFPTAIGEYIFLNIKVEQVDDEMNPEDMGYFFAKYKFGEEDSLLISLMDIDGFVKGIQDGKIKGEITYREPVVPGEGRTQSGGKETKVINCVKITDESKNIVNFIKDSNVEDLFSNELKLKRLIVN